jgi:hypothetical protein
LRSRDLVSWVVVVRDRMGLYTMGVQYFFLSLSLIYFFIVQIYFSSGLDF